jgi:hypothetical protein
MSYLSEQLLRWNCVFERTLDGLRSGILIDFHRNTPDIFHATSQTKADVLKLPKYELEVLFVAKVSDVGTGGYLFGSVRSCRNLWRFGER